VTPSHVTNASGLDRGITFSITPPTTYSTCAPFTQPPVGEYSGFGPPKNSSSALLKEAPNLVPFNAPPTAYSDPSLPDQTPLEQLVSDAIVIAFLFFSLPSFSFGFSPH